MEMTVDQMVDFLTDAFPEIGKETLFLILQGHRYNLDQTLEVLILMESEGKSSDKPNPHHLGGILPNPSSPQQKPGEKSVKKREKRGAHVVLPDDFLRVPGFNEKRQEYVETGSLVNLLADPLFLEELEREFGPNYQSVLREHLQAEALRNTADRAPYSDQAASPREFYVQSSSLSSQRAAPPYAPFTTQYYNQTPPPYAQATININQQHPAVLGHQSSLTQSPTSSTSTASSSSHSNAWFTSPFSSLTTGSAPPPPPPSSDQSRQPLIGFGGGDPLPPPREQDGPSSKFLSLSPL
jgi:hypothetical protein